MSGLFDIRDNVVLDLRMDETGTVRDRSGKGNDGSTVSMDSSNIVYGLSASDKGLLGNGTDERVDVGDIETIYSMVIVTKPLSTTEEVAILSAGNTITISGGTLTFTGFSPTAYVDGQASTTVVANRFQTLAFTLAAGIDANDLELFWDGSGYGNQVITRSIAFTTGLTPTQHLWLNNAIRRGLF